MYTMLDMLRRTLFSALIGLALAGCPDGVPDDDACDVQRDVFSKSCTFSTCHNATDRGGSLDLESMGWEARLIEQPAAGEECAGMGTLVVPGDADMSLLWQKLAPNPPCGITMPFAQQPLTTAAKQCVRDWIVAQ